MTALTSVSRTAWGNGGHGALARALRDPRVVGVARSMNIDLEDPGTVNALLGKTKQILDASTRVTLNARTAGAADEGDIAVDAIRNTYVRNAIRTYETVSRLI